VSRIKRITQWLSSRERTTAPTDTCRIPIHDEAKLEAQYLRPSAVLNPELLAALSGAPQAADSFLIQDGAETVPRRVPAASILNPELLSAFSGAPQAADSFLIQDGSEAVPRLVPAASILNPNLLDSETGGLTSTEHLLVQVNGESVPRVMDASLLPTGAETMQDLPCFSDYGTAAGGSPLSSSYST
jgi:hypothetical protein